MRSLLAVWVMLGACTNGSDAAADGGADDAGAPSRPFAVGTQRIEVVVSASRTVPAQLWYPAVDSARAEADAARSASELEPAGQRRSQLAELFEGAPQGCATDTMHAADAPEPLAGTAFPLVLISHCHSGARTGYFSLAEQLARLGYVVAAADHTGDTIYDELAGTPGVPDVSALEQRYEDVSALLALLLDEGAEAIPAGLRGAADPERIAVIGHSFGSITAGLVSFRKPAIKASVFIAAPPEVPLLGSATVLAELTAPALFFYASEDSIPTILNDDIRNNYASYPEEAWLVELEDAGHFAFSDLCGTHAALMAGCGTAQRQTDPQQSFTYLDAAVVRDATLRYVTAFLDRVLLGGPGRALDDASPNAVRISHHE